MAKVPKFTTDLHIIASLGINPGPDNGLDPEQLQAKFDEASVLLQNFINDEIIPVVNNFVASSDGLLSIEGGTMSGNISMGDMYKVTNMLSPVNAGDAATKGYVDKTSKGYLPKKGGTMEGAIAMGGNKLSGIPTPEADEDAASKGYTDGVVKEKVNGSIKAISGTLYANQWDGKYQTVPLSDITKTMNIWVSENGNDIPSVIAWANSIIRCCEQGDGWLKFCYYGDEKPENDVGINVFAEVGA